jgi:hypothetical protein
VHEFVCFPDEPDLVCNCLVDDDTVLTFTVSDPLGYGQPTPDVEELGIMQACTIPELLLHVLDRCHVTVDELPY